MSLSCDRPGPEHQRAWADPVHHTAERQLALLREANRVLTGARDCGTALASLARLSVPFIADLCVIDALGPDGTPQRVAAAHANPEADRIAREQLIRYPPRLASSHPISHVLRTGATQLVPAITEDDLRSAARSEAHLGLLRHLGLRAGLVVPLQLRGQTLGAMAFVCTTEGRHLGNDDIALATDMAALAALAMDTAQLAGGAGAARAEADAERTRMAGIFKQIPAAVGITRGPDHILESVNAAFRQIFGDRRYHGRPARELFPDLEGQGLLEQLDAVYHGGEPYVGTGVPVTWRNGGTSSEGFANFVYQPLRDATGRVDGVLVFAVDVTAQVRARAEAEAENQAKSRFLAVMSHELRTPLTAIMGYEELLADGITGPVTEAQHGQLERIKISAVHLLALIDELLTLSRIEAERETVHPERIDAAAALDEAAAIVAPLAADKQLPLSVERPPRPLQLETDPDKLRQILVNLLTNAVKYTERGSVTLQCLPERTGVAFAVRDTGIGIAPEDQERIFEAFFQVEHYPTRRVGGTGLGLSVARRLGHLLGGRIAVESAVGVGSTFTLRLPLR
ncbi:MAG TPA: ATP-binding protein [Gemmatimonadaceae bacterium]|nr:ATP-binding protein [Gemmatimonadaceae bacterium]